MDNTKEYILCAAIKRIEPRNDSTMYYNNDICSIEIGYRHHDIIRRFQNEISRNPKDQGFYTSKGRFVSREEAMEIAYKANQIKDNVQVFKNSDEKKYRQLFSEDLY